MGYTKEEKAMLWLDGLALDYAKKAQLLHAFRDPYEIVARFSERESEIGGITGEKMLHAMRASLEDGGAAALLESYRAAGVSCVTCFSELYPEALRAADNPPFVLYCRGNTRLLRERKFAIVGSRRTPPQIAERTKRIAAGLSGPFAIVTGHADGGDTAAILGALESGRLICVLAFGFAHVAQAENAALLEKIAERGLLVTEYVPAQPAQRYTFPARNRIIAGLAEGVLVVSGGERSGTRITARHAYDLGRDVFAFPYAIGDPAGAGCNKLIKDYAKLTENLVDITSVFGINLTEKEAAPLTGTEKRVYDCLGAEPVHTSRIAAQAGMKEAELSPVLIMLAMKKRAVSCGGNRWARI